MQYRSRHVTGRITKCLIYDRMCRHCDDCKGMRRLMSQFRHNVDKYIKQDLNRIQKGR